MTRTPRMTGRQLISALRKAGFEVTRTRGSHNYMQHPDGRFTVVPAHKGEITGAGLLNKIIHDTDLSIRQLHELL